MQIEKIAQLTERLINENDDGRNGKKITKFFRDVFNISNRQPLNIGDSAIRFPPENNITPELYGAYQCIQTGCKGQKVITYYIVTINDENITFALSAYQN